MIVRALGAVGIAASVVATSLPAVKPALEPVRSARLFAQRFSLPFDDAFGPDLPMAPAGIDQSFIPDALAGWRGDSDADTAYDASLNALLNVQRPLQKRLDAEYAARETMNATAAQVLSLERQLSRIQSGDRTGTDVQSVSASLNRARAELDLAQRRLTTAENQVREILPSVTSATQTAAAAGDEWRASVDPRLRDDPGFHQIFVQRGTLMVMFKPEVSIDQQASLLRSHRLGVESSIPRISLYTVVSTAPQPPEAEAESTRLRAIAQDLRESGLVIAAVPNTMLTQHFLPKPNAPTPRKWLETNNVLTAGHHVQAWNFEHRMAHGTKVGILDVGFDTSNRNPDIAPDPAKPVGSIPPCAATSRLHGTLVAGVIGAQFDDGKGVDGAAPFVDMVSCAPPKVRCNDQALLRAFNGDRDLCSRSESASGFIYGLETLLAQGIEIVNASVGYDWGHTDAEKSKTLIEQQGAIALAVMQGYPNAILISSAGNDFGQDAKWGSPFNWAALGSNTPASNIVVVEAMFVGGGRIPQSNQNAMVRALGSNVVAGVDLLDDKHPELFCDFTSGAAPLVTATVAMMKSLNSSLKPDAIKKCLKISAGTPVELNAFTAVRDCVPNSAAILADLDRDNDVDNDDFLEFRDEFRAVATSAAARFGRADMNGDGEIDEKDLDILGEARHLSTADLDRLKQRLRE